MPFLKQRIEKIIKSETPGGPFFMETSLRALSRVYGALARLKSDAYERRVCRQKKLPCAVVSIGNITVGGTGKTPMTVYLARAVKSAGYDVAIVSRGYRGESEKTGGIVTDGNRIFLPPEAAGDEPHMMASTLTGVPVVVGQNRYKAGMHAIDAFSPSVIILDDGFQHMKLGRDVNLLLVDHERPFGNGHLLPRGTLREPVSALKRADIIVETRCIAGKETDESLRNALNRYARGKPLFQSMHAPHISHVIRGAQSVMPMAIREPSDLPPSVLEGKRVYAFSGLAGNRHFHRTLVDIGCILVGSKEFPDHYWYRHDDLLDVQQHADDQKAEIIVTTRKDTARIANDHAWQIDVAVLDITPEFGDQTDAFHQLINGWIARMISKTMANTKRLPA